MPQDPQSRKWQLTINNPLEKGFDHDNIKSALHKLKSVVYWCMADEVGEENTPHTHIYFACSSPVRFSTVKNLFPSAHSEAAHGSSQENRNYIAKEDKWADDVKHGTKVDGTFEEFGEMPSDNRRGYSEYNEIIDRIRDGATNAEILSENPDFFRVMRDVEYVRQILKAEEYREKWRNIETVYIWGTTGVGKTRFVMDGCGYSNVYAVNDYKHPFDGYAGENVMLFDEFNSNFRIQDMNNYLDGYPLSLPARYSNKQACFERVFIISNLDLWEQYHQERLNQRSVWDAFIRRIHKVVRFMPDGTLQEYTTDEYLSDKVK